MTQTQSQGPTVSVKPQPNIYTVLLMVAIATLVAAVAISLNNLLGNYGMALGEIFDPGYKIPPLR